MRRTGIKVVTEEMISPPMSEADGAMEWKDMTLDGEVIGFSRQIGDRVCVVVNGC